MNSKHRRIFTETDFDFEKRRQLIKQRQKLSDLILDKYKYKVNSPKKKLQKTTTSINFLPSINEFSSPNKQIKKRKKYYVKLIKKPKQDIEEIIQPKDNDDQILFLNKDKITFPEYLKIQARAEQKLRPLRGDMTTQFFDYIKRINDIRNSVMEREVEKILDTEDRYNDEYPDEDTKVILTDKGLNNYKWKNLFPLHDYQNFFLDEIKGKISSVNYRSMLRKFRQISKICFANGKLNFASITHNLGEY